MINTKYKKLIPPRKVEVQYSQHSLASVISNMRISHPITLRELSSLSGISIKTLWRFENGKAVKLDTVLKILDVFGCDLQVIEKERDTFLDELESFNV